MIKDEIEKLVLEIEAIENMYLDKKQVLHRLKLILKRHGKNKIEKCKCKINL